MALISDLKEKFQRGGIHIKLIYANVLIFLVVSLLEVALALFNRSMTGAVEVFCLPASVSQFLSRPWSLLTYMFLHTDLLHLLFNMLWLYWFGNYFLLFFSSKHLRGVYLLGGFAGGLFYMLAYNVFPLFEGAVGSSVLLGASAAVIAIVVAAACKAPNQKVPLMFFGNVSLKYIALTMLVLDLLMITSSNAGGHISHIGGALSGLLFCYGLSKGVDLTSWINSIADLLLYPFQKRPKRAKMKVHRTSERESDYEFNQRKHDREKEVDRILEKIKKTGYSNLTEEEKKELFDASKRGKK